jgi:predicted transcriptional regulator
MSEGVGSQIFEVDRDEALEAFRALSLPIRISILQLLSLGDKNINELGAALGVSQPAVTKHIQQLEKAGLIESEHIPGVQGMQKRCRLKHRQLIFKFEPAFALQDRVDEISMPIGLYTMVNPGGSCGLANRNKIIGYPDKPQSFYDPERGTAEILWMASGFVEYTFANDLPTSMLVERLELSMEICSEAFDHNPDRPSDITLWVNGTEIGTWTSPGDLRGNRGVLTPGWWAAHMTQYGMLKIWSVDDSGAYVDGTRVSETTVARLLLSPQKPITIRLGVKPDAEHQGGFNLFGRGFGNYPQDLLLRLHYDTNRISGYSADTAPFDQRHRH